MAYPRNLGYMVHRLAGYHRNTFRIESTTTQTASAGRIVTVNLPENAIIDLKSFRWVITDATTSYDNSTALAGGAANSGVVTGKLPFAQALIQRMEVYVNGVQVTQGCIEYNTAFRLQRNAKVNTSKSLSIDSAVQNSILDSGEWANAQYANANVGQDLQMIVSDWLGLFEAPSTRFLDTGLVGLITVRLTLADNNVLTPKVVGTAITAAVPAAQANVAAQISYTLQNFYFTIDSISLADGMYDMLLRKKLARDGYLSINFDEYYAFLQDGNTSTATTVRFAVSSQSINKIYGTLRASSVNNGAGIYNYTARGNPADNVGANANAFVEAYQPQYFKFRNFCTDNSFKWNFSVNNVYHPQYLAGELEGLAQLVLTENKVGFEPTGNQITSFQEYRNNKFCVGIRLNHPIDGEMRNTYVSGYDSRGVNAQLVWNLQNINAMAAGGAFAGGTYCAYVLVNTTNTLRFGVGRSLEVIF